MDINKNTWKRYFIPNIESLSLNRMDNTRIYKNWEYKFRKYPSGGGIFPIVIYFYVWNVKNMDNGWYLYNIEKEKIIFFKKSNSVSDLNKLSPVFEGCDLNKKSFCTLFLVNDIKNQVNKYSFNSIRLSLIECGHIAQNILLQSTLHEVDTLPIGGFYNDLVKEQLEINDELINLEYIVHLG